MAKLWSEIDHSADGFWFDEDITNTPKGEFENENEGDEIYEIWKWELKKKVVDSQKSCQNYGFKDLPKRDG